MDKGDFRAVGPIPWNGVNHLDSTGSELSNGLGCIIHPQGDMMDARASFGDKFGHGAIGVSWLQELNRALPQGEEGSPHLLFSHRFIAGVFQAKSIPK